MLETVLYGCETHFPTLGKENKLKVSKNKVHKRIYGLRRKKVNWQLSLLHNETLFDVVGIVKLEVYDAWAKHRPTRRKREMHT
jgi:hypothetical protein